MKAPGYAVPPLAPSDAVPPLAPSDAVPPLAPSDACSVGSDILSPSLRIIWSVRRDRYPVRRYS